ncbi:MAG: integrin alpha [Myxococcota bacterium]
MRVTLLLAVALVGCGNHERDCENGADDDGDGWRDCSDQDCAAVCGESCANFLDDDGNGLVDCADPACDSSCPNPPGSNEDCANGADDDGDWLVDCGDDDCDPVCDGDADTWIDVDYGGDDCDDDDPGVHPTATELPYDGHDQDCDPATPDDDVDADGFPLASDCDDADGLTFPGAPETCGDATINDCDHTGPDPSRGDCFGERSALTADATVLGSSNDDWAGFAVAGAGDVDGDGHRDLIVGAYGEGEDSTGAAFVVRGPLTGESDLATAAVKWIGESEDDWAGFAVAGGQDLTGDGLPDLAIGAHYDDETGHSGGAVYIVRGGGEGIVELGAAAWAKIVSEEAYDQAGQAIATAGDVNADGFGDLLIGSPLNSKNGNKAGMAHLVYGPIANGALELSEVTYRLVGEQPGDNAGCAVAGPGDLDGDGQSDLVVGVCLTDRGGLDGGGAFQFSTHEDIDRLVSDADGAMVAEAPGDAVGSALAGGDLDNDGLADLLIGAPGWDGDGGEDHGAVYVADGPATTSMNTPDAKITGVAAGDRAGTAVTVVHDLDGDGFGELVIGAPGSDTTGEDAGAVYVMFGPVFGLRSLDEADVQIDGAGAFDFLGQAVAAPGDLDGDGWDDLVVGAPYHDGLAPSGGAAYLFTFGW